MKKATKKTKVTDILNLMNDNNRVDVVIYAYGIYYAETMRDGMNTVADCKENMNYSCMNACVTGINSATDKDGAVTVIHAEVVS